VVVTIGGSPVILVSVTVTMDSTQPMSLDQIRDFLKGTEEVEFAGLDRASVSSGWRRRCAGSATAN